MRFLQKIQSELSGHEATLEDMRKKNEDKKPSHRILGQIDLTQVQHTLTLYVCLDPLRKHFGL